MIKLEEYQLTDNKVLRIYQDEDAQNPRDDDNLGSLFCFHKRYTLGDKNKNEIDASDFRNWDEMETFLLKTYDYVFPVYLFDHSGLAISMTTFSCKWDSGQIGFICVSKDRLAQAGFNELSDTEIRAYMKGEIARYNDYLQGNVYGFEIVETVLCSACARRHENILEAVWGFYGDNYLTAMIEYLYGEDKLALTSSNGGYRYGTK